MKLKGITCCGLCGNYNWKKHKCNLCNDAGEPQDSFYADCQLPDVVPAEELKAAQEQIKMLETLVFGIVRNSSVYPTGVALGKSQKEVTLKTFETIEEIKKIMDFDRMREFMALKEATDEENT